MNNRLYIQEETNAPAVNLSQGCCIIFYGKHAVVIMSWLIGVRRVCALDAFKWRNLTECVNLDSKKVVLTLE